MRWSATTASNETRQKFRQMLRAGELDEREIDVEVSDSGGGALPTFEIPGVPGAQMGMLNLNDIFGKAMGGRKKTRKMTITESHKVLVEEESDKLLDQERVLSEVDRGGRAERHRLPRRDRQDLRPRGAPRRRRRVSREGVQRDLLPLLEGTTVATKHGTVKTDHILFIASGAFHLAKPSDLLPELQGRLPIRVELKALSHEDFVRILTEPEASLIKQYVALLATERVTLDFTEDGIREIASTAYQVNESVENIGARRLQTVMERLLEEVSFTAADTPGISLTIDAAYVRKQVGDLAKNADLSKFIL